MRFISRTVWVPPVDGRFLDLWLWEAVAAASCLGPWAGSAKGCGWEPTPQGDSGHCHHLGSYTQPHPLTPRLLSSSILQNIATQSQHWPIMCYLHRNHWVGGRFWFPGWEEGRQRKPTWVRAVAEVPWCGTVFGVSSCPLKYRRYKIHVIYGK